MFGLGHGGLESMVVIGGSIILTLLNLAFLSVIGVNNLPAAPRHVVIQQFSAINAQPFWVPLLPAWGRLWTVPLQIAESVIVLQVFRRRQMGWLFLAFLSHALIDFLSAAFRQALYFESLLREFRRHEIRIF